MFLFLSVVEYVNPKSPRIIIHDTSVSFSAAFIMQKMTFYDWSYMTTIGINN
jgi:hypothetical protein